MEDLVRLLTGYVSNVAHLLALLVISIGMAKALWSFLKDTILLEDSREAMTESRLEMGHAFSLALGFLIGASILKSVVAPNWNEIGQLTAIIIIRTLLNYFLIRDISESSRVFSKKNAKRHKNAKKRQE